MTHGGNFIPYLDNKSLVCVILFQHSPALLPKIAHSTHIITCSLTPAKIRDWRYMKIATPRWIVDSVSQGKLLDWRDYRFRPGDHLAKPQGGGATQTSLFPPAPPKKTRVGMKESTNFVGRTEVMGENIHPAVLDALDDMMSGSASTVTKELAIVKAPLPLPRDSAIISSQHDERHSPSRIPSSEHASDASPVPIQKATRVPSYAAHESNPHAQRAMADASWRAAHTSANPDFVAGYYRNSRLHYLSTWKAELKNLVQEAQERAESGSMMEGHKFAPPGVGFERMSATKARRDPKGKGKARERERVIMHCDFDSFFVSAGLLARPELRGKPAVVCHSQGAQGGTSSTSEIASASYEARAYGIKGGMR
jgi:DNA repair protein REV1